MGSDLGAAIKNFRGAVKEGEEDKPGEEKDTTFNAMEDYSTVEGLGWLAPDVCDKLG